MKHSIVVVAAALIVLANVASARATNLTLGFNCITANSPADCAIGESQLSVQLTDLGNQVSLTFSNTGASASSVSEIYFHDANHRLANLPSLMSDSGAGVDFTASGCNPGDLPGDNGFRIGYCTEATSPPSKKGINPAEWLMLTFSYNPSYDFSALKAGLVDGTFALGMHVIAFDNGGSVALVNKRPEVPVGSHNNTVPEPATLLLFGGGIAAAVARARRRARTPQG